MKKYGNYSKEQLIDKLIKLEKKKYGLVWEDKPEAIADKCEKELPILVEDKSKEIISDLEKPTHLIFEGDNYHALYTLNFTHQKKIDVIYIDPPYNTGAKDWKYNNNYVDKEDNFRHSKWLSFMEKRLRLAKKLLKDSGILCIAIDHHEMFNLGSMCDKIFHENNRLGIITVQHNPKGRNMAKFFSENSEFVLVYSKKKSLASFQKVAINEDVINSFKLVDEDGKYRLDNFMRVRKDSIRSKKPDFFYPIYVSKDLKKISLTKREDFHEVFPVNNEREEYSWKTLPKTFNERNTKKEYKAEMQNGKISILNKYREQEVIKNVWVEKKYQSEFNGTNLLKKIIGKNVFSYPKSLYAILDILKITTNKNAIILDFFAGSGTTAHAVLELNKQDGGNRQFIVCTNNEVGLESENIFCKKYNITAKELKGWKDENKPKWLNWCEKNGICSTVTYPRIKNVINGYAGNDGIPANVKYFKTDFVPVVLTDNDKRVLVEKSTELICIAENTFGVVRQKEILDYAIFSNFDQHTAIIYDENCIDRCCNELNKIKPEHKTIVYVFSYDHTYNEEDFISLNIDFMVKPIPEAIINIYRKISKLKNK